MHWCIVKLCKNSTSHEDKNVSFHRFPRAEWKRKKWMEALELNHIRTAAVICSDHFHQNDFINHEDKTRRRLYPSAIPFLTESQQEAHVLSQNSPEKNKNYNEEDSCSDDGSANSSYVMEEELKAKIETLRRSEDKSQRKIKKLYKKIQRKTSKMGALKEVVSNLKHKKIIPAKDLNINDNFNASLITTDLKVHGISNSPLLPTEDNFKSSGMPGSPDSSVTVLNIDEHDQSELLDPTNETTKFNEDRLVFEVNFKNEEIFMEFKDLVVEGLRVTLKDKGYFFVLEEVNKVQVFREPLDDENPSTAKNCDVVTQQREEANSEPKSLSDAKSRITTAEHKLWSKNYETDITIEIQSSEILDSQVPSHNSTKGEDVMNKNSAQGKTKPDDEWKCNCKCNRPKKTRCCSYCNKAGHNQQTCPALRNDKKYRKQTKHSGQGGKQSRLPFNWKFVQMKEPFESHSTSSLLDSTDPLD